MTLDGIRTALKQVNVSAFLRVIRERESGQDDSAYTVVNGGTHFPAPPWRHPFSGVATTHGGRAAGAYQFLGTTWARLADQYDFPDFSPEYQDLGAVALIAGRGALPDLLAGQFDLAVAKCRPEWTSLPGAAEASGAWTMEKARECYAGYGGSFASLGRAIPAPTAAPAEPAVQPAVVAKQGASMPILALISAFGPLIAQLIPQVASIFKPATEVSQRNVALAQTIFDTVVKATDSPNIQAAVEKMQADPDAVVKATQAVVTQPDIMVVLELGEGGIKAAADRSLEIQKADKPFWYNPLTWVTLAFFPMMYMITYQVLFTLAGPYMVSNGVPNTPLVPNPWFAVVGFDSNTRTGLINLIVGFVFGGVCGIWFGTTVAKQRDQSASDQAAADAAAK